MCPRGEVGGDRGYTLAMLTAKALTGLNGVTHGFFTREGGVSTGVYASLNCGQGSADDPANVAENRARAMARLGLGSDALATAYQVHSADVAVVETPWPVDERPQLDALVTRTPGVAIGILTADCAPVLFADADAGVIGAAHAGWRGALCGVVEATVSAMTDLGASPERTVAAVGPCIGRSSYEVGPEFRTDFVADDSASADLFEPAPRAGHFLFDLAGYVARRLDALGLVGIDVLPFDTCADEARFFSYRRTTKNGGGDYGRGFSAIGLEP